MIKADIVTVFHNDENHRLHLELLNAIRCHEPDGGYRFIGIDNRRVNRGFALACNLGAFAESADAPIIGFLNPDIAIDGPFLDTVTTTIDQDTVICGCRFGKPDRELAIWGVRDWVCGAAMFVQRRWFHSVGGFDTQFVWSWEETDLIRQAQAQGRTCRSITLPLRHDKPRTDSTADARYKQQQFDVGERRFRAKWG